MNELTAIISGLNLLGLGGVGVFLYYLFKGLSEKIKTLTEITKEQEKTLAVVRDRAVELEKWRDEYKRMVSDFQDIGSKLDIRRNALVKELEEANRKKDGELSELKSAQIKEVELRQNSFHKAQELEKELTKTKAELDRQLKILQPWQLSDGGADYKIDWSHINTPFLSGTPSNWIWSFDVNPPRSDPPKKDPPKKDE